MKTITGQTFAEDQYIQQIANNIDSAYGIAGSEDLQYDIDAITQIVENELSEVWEGEEQVFFTEEVKQTIINKLLAEDYS